MNIYKVDEIIFKLNSIFNKSYLNSYKSRETLFNYEITINVLDDIINVNNKRSNYQIIKDNYKERYFINNNLVTAKVIHDLNYQNVIISLNKRVTKNLEEASYIYLGIIFLEIALLNNYFPLHATALEVNNEVILVSAKSGVGKSTFRKHFNTKYQANVINDDKPLLKIAEEIKVVGSPFSGVNKLNLNKESKLKVIVLLKRGNVNKIEKIDDKEKVLKLIENSYKPKDDDLWDSYLANIEEIVKRVEIINLYALNDVSASIYLYNYLYGGDYEN